MTLVLSLLPSKTMLDKVLVKGSIKLSAKGIFSTAILPLYIILRIKWYFLSMCLISWWFLGFLDYVTILLLSQNNVTTSTTKGITQSLTRSFLS